MARTKKSVDMGEVLESELSNDGSDSLEVPLQQTEEEHTPEHIEDSEPITPTYVEEKVEEKETEEFSEEGEEEGEEDSEYSPGIVPVNSYIKEGIIYGPNQQPLLDSNGELMKV